MSFTRHWSYSSAVVGISLYLQPSNFPQILLRLLTADTDHEALVMCCAQYILMLTQE